MSRTFKISCCKASELVEKKNISSISFIEKLQLKVHEIICKGCLAYEKQSRLLEEGAKKVFNFYGKKHSLSKEVKDKIISGL